MRTVIHSPAMNIIPPNAKADTSSSLSNLANNHNSQPKQQQQQDPPGGLSSDNTSHAAVVRVISICSRTKEEEMMKRETTTTADDDAAARPVNDIGEFLPPLERRAGSPPRIPPRISRPRILPALDRMDGQKDAQTPLPSPRSGISDISDFSLSPLPLPPPPIESPHLLANNAISPFSSPLARRSRHRRRLPRPRRPPPTTGRGRQRRSSRPRPPRPTTATTAKTRR